MVAIVLLCLLAPQVVAGDEKLTIRESPFNKREWGRKGDVGAGGGGGGEPGPFGPVRDLPPPPPYVPLPWPPFPAACVCEGSKSTKI
jgi:hypothetical protein